MHLGPLYFTKHIQTIVRKPIDFSIGLWILADYQERHLEYCKNRNVTIEEPTKPNSSSKREGKNIKIALRVRK